MTVLRSYPGRDFTYPLTQDVLPVDFKHTISGPQTRGFGRGSGLHRRYPWIGIPLCPAQVEPAGACGGTHYVTNPKAGGVIRGVGGQ